MSDDSKWLRPEWSQRCLAAMADTLDVNADLKREMIQFLLDSGFWDASKLEWPAAVTKFNACLRPDNRENFSNLQLWGLMKRFERYAWFEAMADDLGFEIRRKPTEERRIELLNRLVVALEQANSISAAAQAELHALDIEHPLRVHPALRQGPGSFSLPDAHFDAPSV
jgi:hypothetical protein